MECGGAYTGQTGRKFRIRYKEHIRDIRNNRNKTGCSNHILNTRHTYGNLEDTMPVVNIQNKGPYLNTLERFHIYKEQKTGVILNGNYADLYNPLFERACSRELRVGGTVREEGNTPERDTLVVCTSAMKEVMECPPVRKQVKYELHIDLQSCRRYLLWHYGKYCKTVWYINI
jgi:hypothetical protein